jgi:imidazolonepropionase-like amidohydrolase
MPRKLSLTIILLVTFAPTVHAADADAPLAFRGARILTAAGEPIDAGVLVIQKGKIVAIGPADTAIPEEAKVHDATGKTIIPGLVDTHSHIGIFSRPNVLANEDGNEMSGPVQSVLRALDAIYPDDPGIRMAIAGGVTTANIMPGSGNVIGGQTVYVKLRGRTIEEMRITPATVVGGLKMANGENPKNYARRSQAPYTRMKVAALQREQFLKAREYRQKWTDYRKAVDGGKEATPPERDLALEPLVEVLDHKRTVHFHTHRADDLMTALRIADEFKFEIVLQHATEGYRIVDELVRRKVPVSLTLLDSPGGKLEAAGLLEENAALLDKAGVKVAINTDDFVTESRFFLRTGAIAVRGGMSEAAALRALTLHGAQMLHLDERVGSLEKGKDADFVVLSGPPFSVYTQVLETYIDGVRAYTRDNPKDWAYQAGGFAVAEQARLPKPATLLKPLPTAKEVNGKSSGEIPTKPASLTIYAGRIHTAAGKPIEDGAIQVEDGILKYVGPAADFKPPDRRDNVTLYAREVTPGLIDAHTVVGVSGKLNVPGDQDQDELSEPNQAELRVLDSFNPNEPLLDFLRQQGVTVVHALPGRANVIAGQTGIFHTAGITAEKMTIRFPAGILVNLGEVPKRSYQHKLPQTRMGTAALFRTAFTSAQNYSERRTAKDLTRRPAVSPRLEALRPALTGEIPVIFSAHRADDLVTALRLAKEFKLHAILDLATEGYMAADAIAEAKVPVIAHPTMQRAGTSLETHHTHLGNAAALADHKIPLAIGTGFEGYVPKTRVVRHEAAIAMVNGLGRDRALKVITLDAARILKIDDRFGSLEVGKVADIVLYDGDPFEYATHVTYTIEGGRVVFSRADYLKLPFDRRALPLATGGVGCCMGAW